MSADPATLDPYRHSRWLRAQLDPAIGLDTARALLVRGPLDPNALRRGLTGLVARHPALRTVYRAGSDGPVAVPAPPGPIEVHTEPVPDLDAARERAVAAAAAPVDPGTGPMLRARLYRITPDEHVLLLLVHPMAVDWRSLGLLAGELIGVIEPDDAVTEAPSEPDREFWAERLDGLDALQLAVPGAASATPADGTERPGLRPLDVPLQPGLLARLRAAADRHGAPLPAVVLAAVQLLLNRYTGVHDIALGLPVGLVSDGVGAAVNTVVVRVDVHTAGTVGALVERTAAELAAAVAHRSTPFADLARRIDTASSSEGRGPTDSAAGEVLVLVDSLLAPGIEDPGLAALVMGRPGPAIAVQGAVGRLSLTPLPLRAYARLGDVAVLVSHVGAPLRVSLLTDPARVPPGLAGHLAADLRTVLVELAAEPGRPVDTVLPVPRIEAGRADAVEEPADTVETTVALRFAEWARRAPERLALLDDTASLSYGELAEAAGRITAVVAAHGGERVGLLYDHAAPVVAAMLGTLGAGRCYVPLDPRYPAERLAYMVGDADLDLLLTQSAHRDLAAELLSRAGRATARVIATDADLGDVSPAAPVAGTPDDPAYILYTSGSTGRPKGVVQNHRNMLFQARHHAAEHRIGPDDRLSVLSSYSFDAAVTDTYTALLTGASAVLVDIRAVGLPRLARTLTDRAVTIYHSTPTVYRYLLRSLGDGQRLPTIRLVLLGGEEVTGEDLRLHRRYFDDECAFVNGYGATEVSFALQYDVGLDEAVGADVVPIGHPLPGLTVELLAPGGQPAALYGQIAVTGRYVAPGYWRRPEEQAARFTDHGDGIRTYRTGDMGRREPGGAIRYAGRGDDQIKVRGYRVALGEVEAALVQEPSVAAVAVVPRGDRSSGAEEIVAYAVPVDAATFDPTAVRTELAEQLPAFMLPAAVVPVEALPLTPTGKIDARALPDVEEMLARRPAVRPRDDTEAAIAAAWCAVLEVGAVGVEDNFFDVGGHSLSMALLAQRLESELGVALPLARMFEYPTVAALARFVSSARAGVGPGEHGRAARAAVHDRLARRRAARRRAADPA